MNTPLAPVVCVVGARPNFMKMAAVLPALRAVGLPVFLVHTGQHYDESMKDSFFRQLGIPEPDIDLGVGSGSHAVQTAETMKRFEPVLDQHGASAVLVVGDVNSTIACALVAVKKGIPIIHVEAGLRSGDRTMPEEINRVLTDQISDLLFLTEQEASLNLEREGIVGEQRVHFVGNVMIDTLRRLQAAAPTPEAALAGIPEAAGFPCGARQFGLVTLHRPANVDDPVVLTRLLQYLRQVGERLPLIFPIHPRTRGRIAATGLNELLTRPNFLALPPLGYLETLGLMSNSRLVLTDSGGIQEETTALGVPCVTLRPNTERPITITQGTNTLVGNLPEQIAPVVDEILATGGKAGKVPELWDGHAAERIAAIVRRFLQ